VTQRRDSRLEEELMWDRIGQLHAYHGHVPVDIRLLKPTEEVGEVADAFLGVHGLNKRKGVCRSREDLLDELADVIITAAVAMSGITGDTDEARSQPSPPAPRDWPCSMRPPGWPWTAGCRTSSGPSSPSARTRSARPGDAPGRGTS
jgi:NTP pyrophosphatase (non-canonical NTP hydrolase)